MRCEWGWLGMPQFEGRTFRDTMGQFCTGVVIVTSLSNDNLAGFAAQSFVSLSESPPLIAICPQKASTSWPKIRATGHFGINVLRSDQSEVSNAFARKGGVADIGWAKSKTGSPILDGVIAFIDCELGAEHEAGDHTIVIGHVVDLEIIDAEAEPLLFFRGEYGQFATR